MKKEEFKKTVTSFFNRLAFTWEEHLIRDDEIIETILDNVGIKEGDVVLDVGTGTGVLLSYYLKRNVKRIVAIDIAENMISIAKSLYDDERIEFVNDDVEIHEFNELFDRIVVYNSFPHFSDPEALVRTLSSLLKENGTLSIAHSMSRERINLHHENVKDVSLELMEIEDLKKIFERYLKVEITVSNAKTYQITGKKSLK